MSDSPRLDFVETSVHGRYWVREASSNSQSPVLVGFHGYGEDAEALLREVNLIPGLTTWKLVAIQGLHPFYRVRTGEVVASWMTRLDREMAIADNIRYVAQVLIRELGAGPYTAPLVYTGFSQGTAMAYRAAAGVGRPCSAVVALGGDVPAELAEGQLAEVPIALLGRGDRDEWYSEEKLLRDQEVLEGQGIKVRPVRYRGGHEWTDGFRAVLGRFLDGLQPDPSE